MSENNGNWQSTVVSIFPNAMVADKPTEITIGEVLEKIRTGFWKTPVERVSGKYSTAYKTAVADGNPDPAAVAKRASMALKKKLPALTPSGRFEKRCEAGIIEHSGILCLDIDHNLEREKVNSSPNVQFSFRSPTGSGL
ncbi:MAG: BT4734/BF3469 family protein, partial [Terrimicrobiaceae bacterium]